MAGLTNSFPRMLSEEEGQYPTNRDNFYQTDRSSVAVDGKLFVVRKPLSCQKFLPRDLLPRDLLPKVLPKVLWMNAETFEEQGQPRGRFRCRRWRTLRINYIKGQSFNMLDEFVAAIVLATLVVLLPRFRPRVLISHCDEASSCFISWVYIFWCCLSFYCFINFWNFSINEQGVPSLFKRDFIKTI